MKPYYETPLGKLYHGDCLEIMPQLEPVDLILTDPPYGVGWNGKITRGKNGTGKQGPTRSYGKKVFNDDMPFDPTPFLFFKNVIIWGLQHHLKKLPPGSVLVWIKRFDSGFGSFLSDADLAWMKGGHGVYCKRDLSLQGDSKNRRHPTKKPIPLMQWCIDKSKTNGTVLDPFLGSGTTAIACERLKRKWIGIEIEEKYCEIAAKRIEQERKQLKMF